MQMLTQMNSNLLSRRELIFSLAPAVLVAGGDDDRTAISEMLGSLVGSLSEDNAIAAMKWFAPEMPNRDKLQRQLTALVEKYEVSASISILSYGKGDLLLDWFLELKVRNSEATVDRRRANIKCRVGKVGKVGKRDSGWRILNLEPDQFFE